MGVRTQPAALEILREHPVPAAFLRPGLHAFSALRERGIPLPPQSRRQLDFDAGRLCARRALERAGRETATPIPRGPDRAPVWPEGCVGSITHTDRRVTAVVADARTYLGVGIDVEHWMSASAAEEVIPQIDTGIELAVLTRAMPMGPAQAATILFSAKESVYKALAPRAGRYFGFEAAALITACPLETGSAELTLELREELSVELPRGLRVSVRADWDAQGVDTIALVSSAT